MNSVLDSSVSLPALPSTPSYRAMSICLEDLRLLPSDVRPDKVEIFFGSQVAYTIQVDEGVEAPNLAFRSSSETLATALVVSFGYLIEEADGVPVQGTYQSHIVFQRDAKGMVVVDKLLELFAHSAMLVAA